VGVSPVGTGSGAGTVIGATGGIAPAGGGAAGGIGGV